MAARRRAVQLMKWGGPVVAAALAVAWWCSGTMWIAHVGPGDWFARVSAGVVSLSYEPGLIAQNEQMTGVPMPRGLWTARGSSRMQWRFGGAWSPAPKGVTVPLWFPIVLVAGLSAVAWRMDSAARRRARIGCCPKCHYNRAGLPAANPCPECGATGQPT